MFKPSGNPKVIELTKSWKGRVYRLTDFEVMKLDGIHKNCVWCLGLLSRNQRKWCSLDCVSSALAWTRPQTAHGLRVLLERQNECCAECFLSYKSYLTTALLKVRRFNWIQPTKFTERYMRAFRKIVPSDIRPEVDHTIPIHLGGPALGLENHKILCRLCHRKKTNIENKQKYLKFGSPIKGVKKTDSHKKNMSISRKGFDSENRRNSRKANVYPKLCKPIVAINLITKEEIFFNSGAEAAKLLNLQECNISRVLKGDQNRKQHKGWTFKYR